jgi:hypothetical protein
VVFKQIWNSFASDKFSLPAKPARPARWGEAQKLGAHGFLKNYGPARMIRAFLRNLGIIPGFEF